MSSDELNYYRERAQIERQRAAESTNPHVVEIHRKLAGLYEQLVDLGESPMQAPVSFSLNGHAQA